jgi:hypothetical protein
VYVNLHTVTKSNFWHGLKDDISDVGCKDRYDQNRKRVSIHNGNNFAFAHLNSLYNTVIDNSRSPCIGSRARLIRYAV